MRFHPPFSFCILFVVTLISAQAACAGGENLAKGKPYTFSIPPNYPLCTDAGDPTDLTDGVYVDVPKTSSLWGQKGCVGWQHTRAPVAITIDLGQVQPISGVALRSAANASGVSFPSSILVQVSDDGKNYVTAGDLVRLAEGPSHKPYNFYEEYLFKTSHLSTRGRYVRFNIVPSSIFIFIDEIEIHPGDKSLLTAPLRGTPASESEITDPLRLTQLGVHGRIRSDIDAVKSMVNTYAPNTSRNELLNELSRLRQQNDTTAYPQELDGFRAVMPLNKLHAQVLAVYGRALAANKYEPLTLWHTPPYRMLNLLERPMGNMPALSVRMMLDEHRAEVFNLTNASDQSRIVRFSLEGIPADVVCVYQVEYVDTREFAVVASALVKLSANKGEYLTTVPAGMTRQIWLSFNPTKPSHAGTYAGQVIVESGDFRKTIDLKLLVAPISMPKRMSCSMGMWDYVTDLNYQITAKNAAAAVVDMRSHLADTVWCGPGSVPVPKPSVIDAQGNLTGAIDYTAWDKFVRLWPDAGHYMAFAAFHDNSTLAGLSQGTEAFDRLVRQWAADWAKHNKEVLGLAPGQVMLLTLDEPGAAEHFLTTARFARPFRTGTRDILLFVDPVGIGAHEVEHAKEALELADIVSPTLGQYRSGPSELRAFYQQLRADGKQLWFYDCSGPTRHFDPSYYRLQPWFAFAAGGNGSQFWAYGDAGGANSWNEYAAIGRQSFTPVYISPDSITTSKHWEAAREGIQDYEYAVMLRAKIDSLDKASAERARKLLADVSWDNLQQNVVNYNKKYPQTFNNASSIGEKLRLNMLDLLAAQR
ncbi:MAG: discoidin domain-containing protein [Phycisphaerales bacterium]|jgi:hypothetical protein|nr:discoidin domain-containing protein [Phycisphaerales bacterium]